MNKANQHRRGPETEIAVAAPVRHFCSLLHERLDRLEARSGLLLGCGSGDEVAYLRRAFQGARVVGMDVSSGFSSRARAEANLVVADAMKLPFPANSFDFAASIHSLEHMGDPLVALAEVSRVLRPRGWFYVGVPNRTRLLGYVGSFDATPWQKVYWNLIDYAHRLRGRFRNELGAHAGFDAAELVGVLESHFTDVQLLTPEYLRFKYGGRMPKPILRLLLAPLILSFSAPSHYSLCRKR